jgi:ribonuclease HI
MERFDPNHVVVYTDGSMLPRPRRGGYAFRIVTMDGTGGEQIHDYAPDGVLGANNQEMELLAILTAIKTLHGKKSPVDLGSFTRVMVYTDSMYVHQHFQTAIYRWSKSRYTRMGGAPVLHAEMWIELVALAQRLPVPVEISWIRRRSCEHASAVDRMAKESARRPYGKQVTVRSVRRKHSDESVEPGSVRSDGQPIDIRLIEASYQRVQRCYRYRYEVLSENSPYCGKVDFAFSDKPLRHRDVHTVILNDDPRHPRIAEVIRSVPAS